MIEHDNKNVSIRQQCKLLNLNRSKIYYQKKPIDKDEFVLMNEIRDIYAKHPFLGYRKIWAMLRLRGTKINQKKIQRLMQKMGLKAIEKKKNLSKANKKDYKFPYLLDGLEIKRPNQVWQIDITYIKIIGGRTAYLVALIDVFSRKIIAWNLTTSIDAEPSVRALEEGVLMHGKPEIVNSDQGCQFTGDWWIKKLKEFRIKISMDGKGRWADNIYIERLWNSIKYECVYLYSLENIKEARRIIAEYIMFYNQERPHQALEYKTPNMIYYSKKSLNEREEKYFKKEKIYSLVIGEKLSELNSLKFY